MPAKREGYAAYFIPSSTTFGYNSLADLGGLWGVNNTLFQKGLQGSAKEYGGKLSGDAAEALRKAMDQGEAQWMWEKGGKFANVEDALRSLDALEQAAKNVKVKDPKVKDEIEQWLKRKDEMQEKAREKYPPKKKSDACP